MPNMSLKKVPMPEQEPNVRNHNFQEVSLGYTKEMAMEEAARCLNCKHKPCVGGCPVNIRIPEFIAKVAEGDFQAAYDIISDTNALPSVSGRVCPQESQCEARCVRAIKGEPVAIGRLERFVADWYRENVNAMPQKPQTNGIKVAVVGSGPASLTCASDLAKHGYEVTIFEAFHTAGGVLVYGIPEFRLPKAIVQNEVDKLTALGVDLETDMVIGKTFDIDEMFEEGYEAVFIGSGAGLPMFMGIEGETLAGVYSANEYLTRINLMKAYREGYDTPLKISGSAAIIGGGPTGMSAAYFVGRAGIPVTLFEKVDRLGGIVRQVIPAFRITNEAIQKDIALMEKYGVEVRCGAPAPSVAELKAMGYTHILYAVGAWKPGRLGIPGDVAGAIQWMKGVKAGNISVGGNVAVVGAGNTAMDAARLAKRSGAQHVTIVYRRTKKYMPADEHELALALADGVTFAELCAPVEQKDGVLRDAKAIAAQRSGTDWSFSDFGQIPEAERPLLDYIFVSGDIEAVRYEVLPDTFDGGYVSDHAPVMAVVKIAK